jgi:hypothetical protein
MAFSRDSLKIRLRDIGYFLLLGGVFMALVQGTYFYTISKIQVAAAILIQYLAPDFRSRLFHAFLEGTSYIHQNRGPFPRLRRMLPRGGRLQPRTSCA